MGSGLLIERMKKKKERRRVGRVDGGSKVEEWEGGNEWW